MRNMGCIEVLSAKACTRVILLRMAIDAVKKASFIKTIHFVPYRAVLRCRHGVRKSLEAECERGTVRIGVESVGARFFGSSHTICR